MSFKRSAVSGAALLALSSLAFAQQAENQPQKIERIEVTGSRIRTIDAETAQPVQTMTSAQIQASGLVTVGDILSTLSSAGTAAFSKGSVLTSNREQGGQYLNLRNLGAQRLLVLVNGKRWTQSNAGYTDMSTVPADLIDRIEVLKDGASSIYGSDALAGVVNIILKKQMDGGKLSVYAGQNSPIGDAKSTDFSLAYGTSNEKGSVLFGLAYNSQGVVWAKSRDVTAYSYGPEHFDAGFGTSPWGRIRQVSAGGTATGFNQILNHTGDYTGNGTGSDATNAANYHAYAGADNDTFNSTSQMMFQSPTHLTTLFSHGEYELPADVHFRSTAMFSDRQSSAQVAGYPFNSLTQPTFPVYLSADSYYNPYGNQALGAGKGQQLFVYRRFTEVPRVTTNDSKAMHFDAGLEGDFTLMSKPWTWNVGVNYSNVDGTVQSTGNLNLFNLKQAMGPSFLNSQGVVQCGTPSNPIALGACVPLNVLGGPSASTAAGLAFVMPVSTATYGTTMRSYTADVTGELFTLPGGAANLALGVEYRTMSGYDIPGALEQAALSTNLAGNPTYGNYSVKEVYGEVDLPLLKGVRGAELLSVNLATRYSDYSSYGSTTNSKGSFMWKPVKDLLFRGTVAQGFRAPTIADLSGGGSQTYDSYLDPCDSKLGQAATNPSVAAACAAAGVPAKFRQLNQAGSPVPAASQSPYPFFSGVGNNSLQPETATTNTLGVMYSPASVTGLVVGLDWFDITINNRITALSTGGILNGCYVQGITSYCSLFHRDATTGMVTSLNRGNVNMGGMNTKGADFTLNYDFPKATWGQIKFRSDSTYVDKFQTQANSSSPWIGVAGEFGLPRLKSNYSFGWDKDAWGVTLSGRYIGTQKSDCWSVSGGVDCSNPNGVWSGGTGYNLQGSTTYFDLAVSYKTTWKGQFQVGVKNVFDKKPIVNIDNASAYGGNSSAASVDPDLPLDRFLWVRYSQPF